MPYLIGLAGASGSGKSTLAERAARELPGVTLVKLDKFFREATDWPVEAGRRNGDLPECLLFDELHEALARLKNGQPARVPDYSKPLGRRLGMRMVRPAPIMLVEGFLLFHDEQVRQLFDLRLYLEVSPQERWRRRRQRDPQLALPYWQEVVEPAFRRYGSPARAQAEVVLDGDGGPEAAWLELRRVITRYLG